MLELLPLAALRLILIRSVVTTTSLEMPLMTINGHNRREWIVAVTHARPLTLSGRFLRYVGTYPRIAFDPVPTRSCPTSLSASHSGAGEVTRPVSSGPADPRLRRSVHRVSRRPPDPARSCLDWPSRPCRVADYAWQRNTPPDGLVGADIDGRIADWSFPLRRRQVRPERFGRSDVGLYVLQRRFEFSNGSCCGYTYHHRSPCRGSEVHDVAMHLQSTACTGSYVHGVGQKCTNRWKRVPSESSRWSSADWSRVPS